MFGLPGGLPQPCGNSHVDRGNWGGRRKNHPLLFRLEAMSCSFSSCRVSGKMIREGISTLQLGDVSKEVIQPIKRHAGHFFCKSSSRMANIILWPIRNDTVLTWNHFMMALE